MVSDVDDMYPSDGDGLYEGAVDTTLSDLRDLRDLRKNDFNPNNLEVYVIAWKDGGKNGDNGVMGPFFVKAVADTVKADYDSYENQMKKENKGYKKTRYTVSVLESNAHELG